MAHHLTLLSAEPARELSDSQDSIADAELMARIAEDDAGALDTLISRYWEALVRFSYGYASNIDVAEDIAQDTFVRVWQRRADWRESGAVTSYLYSIARNLALNRKRRQSTHARSAETLRRRSKRRRAPTPLEEAEAGELLDAVERSIGTLSERRREVFRLSRFEGLSYAEIADVLGISPQTVANHMSTALSQLRELLAPLLEESSRSDSS